MDKFCDVCNLGFGDNKHYLIHCGGILHKETLKRAVVVNSIKQTIAPVIEPRSQLPVEHANSNSDHSGWANIDQYNRSDQQRTLQEYTSAKPIPYTSRQEQQMYPKGGNQHPYNTPPQDQQMYPRESNQPPYKPAPQEQQRYTQRSDEPPYDTPQEEQRYPPPNNPPQEQQMYRKGSNQSPYDPPQEQQSYHQGSNQHPYNPPQEQLMYPQDIVQPVKSKIDRTNISEFLRSQLQYLNAADFEMNRPNNYEISPLYTTKSDNSGVGVTERQTENSLRSGENIAGYHQQIDLQTSGGLSTPWDRYIRKEVDVPLKESFSTDRGRSLYNEPAARGVTRDYTENLKSFPNDSNRLGTARIDDTQSQTDYLPSNRNLPQPSAMETRLWDDKEMKWNKSLITTYSKPTENQAIRLAENRNESTSSKWRAISGEDRAGYEDHSAGYEVHSAGHDLHSLSNRNENTIDNRSTNNNVQQNRTQAIDSSHSFGQFDTTSAARPSFGIERQNRSSLITDSDLQTLQYESQKDEPLRRNEGYVDHVTRNLLNAVDGGPDQDIGSSTLEMWEKLSKDLINQPIEYSAKDRSNVRRVGQRDENSSKNRWEEAARSVDEPIAPTRLKKWEHPSRVDDQGIKHSTQYVVDEAAPRTYGGEVGDTRERWNHLDRQYDQDPGRGIPKNPLSQWKEVSFSSEQGTGQRTTSRVNESVKPATGRAMDDSITGPLTESTKISRPLIREGPESEWSEYNSRSSDERILRSALNQRIDDSSTAAQWNKRIAGTSDQEIGQSYPRQWEDSREAVQGVGPLANVLALCAKIEARELNKPNDTSMIRGDVNLMNESTRISNQRIDGGTMNEWEKLGGKTDQQTGRNWAEDQWGGPPVSVTNQVIERSGVNRGNDPSMMYSDKGGRQSGRNVEEATYSKVTNVWDDSVGQRSEQELRQADFNMVEKTREIERRTIGQWEEPERSNNQEMRGLGVINRWEETSRNEQGRPPKQNRWDEVSRNVEKSIAGRDVRETLREKEWSKDLISSQNVDNKYKSEQDFEQMRSDSKLYDSQSWQKSNIHNRFDQNNSLASEKPSNNKNEELKAAPQPLLHGELLKKYNRSRGQDASDRDPMTDKLDRHYTTKPHDSESVDYLRESNKNVESRFYIESNEERSLTNRQLEKPSNDFQLQASIRSLLDSKVLPATKKATNVSVELSTLIARSHEWLMDSFEPSKIDDNIGVRPSHIPTDTQHTSSASRNTSRVTFKGSSTGFLPPPSSTFSQSMPPPINYNRNEVYYQVASVPSLEMLPRNSITDRDTVTSAVATSFDSGFFGDGILPVPNHPVSVSQSTQAIHSDYSTEFSYAAPNKGPLDRPAQTPQRKVLLPLPEVKRKVLLPLPTASKSMSYNVQEEIMVPLKADNLGGNNYSLSTPGGSQRGWVNNTYVHMLAPSNPSPLGEQRDTGHNRGSSIPSLMGDLMDAGHRKTTAIPSLLDGLWDTGHYIAPSNPRPVGEQRDAGQRSSSSETRSQNLEINQVSSIPVLVAQTRAGSTSLTGSNKPIETSNTAPASQQIYPKNSEGAMTTSVSHIEQQNLGSRSKASRVNNGKGEDTKTISGGSDATPIPVTGKSVNQVYSLSTEETERAGNWWEGFNKQQTSSSSSNTVSTEVSHKSSRSYQSNTSIALNKLSNTYTSTSTKKEDPVKEPTSKIASYPYTSTSTKKEDPVKEPTSKVASYPYTSTSTKKEDPLKESTSKVASYPYTSTSTKKEDPVKEPTSKVARYPYTSKSTNKDDPVKESTSKVENVVKTVNVEVKTSTSKYVAPNSSQSVDIASMKGTAGSKLTDPLYDLSRNLTPEIMTQILGGKMSTEQLQKIAEMLPAELLLRAVEHLQKSAGTESLLQIDTAKVYEDTSKSSSAKNLRKPIVSSTDVSQGAVVKEIPTVIPFLKKQMHPFLKNLMQIDVETPLFRIPEVSESIPWIKEMEGVQSKASSKGTADLKDKLKFDSDAVKQQVSVTKQVIELKDPLPKSNDALSRSNNPKARAKDSWSTSNDPLPISKDLMAISNDSLPKSNDSLPRSNDTLSRSKDTLSRSNDPQSRSNDPQSKSDDPRSKSNDPQSRSNDPQSRSNNPQSRSNDPQSRSNNPLPRSTDSTSRSKDTLAKSSDPVSRSNDPLSRSNNPQSRSNDPQSRSSDPVNRSNDPQSRSNDPQSRSNDSLSKSNDPLPKSHEAPPRSTQTKDPLFELSSRLPPDIMAQIMSGKMSAEQLQQIATMIPSDVLFEAVQSLTKSSGSVAKQDGDMTDHDSSKPDSRRNDGKPFMESMIVTEQKKAGKEDLLKKTDGAPRANNTVEPVAPPSSAGTAKGVKRKLDSVDTNKFVDMSIDDMIGLLQETLKQVLEQLFCEENEVDANDTKPFRNLSSYEKDLVTDIKSITGLKTTTNKILTMLDVVKSMNSDILATLTGLDTAAMAQSMTTKYTVAEMEVMLKKLMPLLLSRDENKSSNTSQHPRGGSASRKDDSATRGPKEPRLENRTTDARRGSDMIEDSSTSNTRREEGQDAMRFIQVIGGGGVGGPDMRYASAMIEGSHTGGWSSRPPFVGQEGYTAVQIRPLMSGAYPNFQIQPPSLLDLPLGPPGYPPIFNGPFVMPPPLPSLFDVLHVLESAVQGVHRLPPPFQANRR